MKIEEVLSNNKKLVVAIPVAIILLPLALSLVLGVCAQGPKPFLEIDKKHDKCVRDTKYMRFRHMHLLKEVRDDVVREGKNSDIELDNCKKCHPRRERFCNRCHDAVNLNPDCFVCHHYPN
jgi:hypothetical protein